MTSGAASLPVRRTLAAVAGREAVAVAAVAGVVIGLLAATWETWGNIGQDTGYDLVAGHLVAHGSVPYADFTYYYGPLSPAVLGLAERIGGPGDLAGRSRSASSSPPRSWPRPMSSPASWRRPTGALLAATITAGVAFAPTNFSFVDPHSYSETLGVLTVARRS